MCGDVEVDEDDDDVNEDKDDVDRLDELFSDGIFLSPKQNVHTVKFVDLSINLFFQNFYLVFYA